MGRFIAIDLARFIAIVGMMCVHVWPAVVPHWWSPQTWADGNASTLFAVLGGVSVGLATRRYEADRWRVPAAAVVVRGMFVVSVGLTLGLVNSPAVVVLVYFGVAVCCSAVFLRARTWVLATSAISLSIIGSIANVLLRTGLDELSETGSISWVDLQHPGLLLRGVFFTGVYPVSTWLVYVLVGMLICRLLLAATTARHTTSFALKLVAAGAAAAAAAGVCSSIVLTSVVVPAMSNLHPELAAALPPGTTLQQILMSPGYGSGSVTAGWPQLLLAAPHTGTITDIAQSTGIAAIIIGALLLVTNNVHPAARRALLIPQRVGASPLTVYCAHVVALGIAVAVSGDESAWWTAGPAALALHLLLAALIGGAVANTHRRAPLETAASLLASRSADRIRTG